MRQALADGVRVRAIPSCDGVYWAGEDGHIYRRSRRGAWLRLSERVEGSAKGASDRGGHLRVNTFVRRRYVSRRVHRLVAEAWVPGYHHLLVVHHVNHDPADNRPGNLACMTAAEHERVHGLYVTDADVTNARLDFELRRGEPEPDPYSRPLPRRKSGAERGASFIAALIARSNNVAARAARAEGKES